VRRAWSRSSRLYLLLSVGLAFAASAMAHAYASRAGAAASGLGPKVPIVVAASIIERGSAIRAGQVQIERAPAVYAPPGSFRRSTQVTGRVALAGLSPGEAVTQTRLARVRAGPVASLVPEGLRAFAVPTSLPAGAIAPGDRVDVMATYGSGQPHTETVVSGVEVLVVLGASEGGKTGGGISFGSSAVGAAATSTLLLLVSPDQEEGLAFASAFANLSVAVAPPVG
jgi:Flp pilus assembly protein CpaB